MKKIIFGLLLAVFSLTNCSKDDAADVNPVINQPNFKIVAVPDSRTVNEGLNTKWLLNDEVNVFHAVTTTTSYINDTPYTDGAGHPFVNTDVANGVFTGTLAEALTEGTSYDWYMFYPYSSYTTTPANTTGGRTYIGCRSDQAQTQIGNDGDEDMAHIAGANYPLFGKATGVAANETPSITMKHVSALVEINLTNKTTVPTTISKITFTSTEDIVGQYYIAFDGDEPTFTKVNNYQSSTAVLNVEEPDEIAVNETVKFYLAVKPHKVENGDLTVSVTTADGACSKTFENITTTFSSGKIKKVSMDVTATVYNTLAEIHAADAEASFNVKNATVIVEANGKYLLKDDTGYIFVYKLGSDVTAPAAGDVINFTGTTSTYGGFRQIAELTAVEQTGTTVPVTHPTATVYTATEMAAIATTAPALGTYVKFDANLSISGNYYNLNMDGLSGMTPSLVKPAQDISAANGSAVTVTGYFVYMTSASTLYPYFMMTDIEYLVVSPKTLTWEATDMTARTVTVSNVANWTVDTSTVPSWATVTVSDNILTVTPTEANGAAEVREAAVTLKHATSNKTATLTLTQKEAGAVTKYYTLVTSAPTDWSGTYLIAYDGMAISGKSGSYLGYTKITFTDNKVASSDETDPYAIVIEAIEGGYAIKLPDETYLGWGSSTKVAVLAALPSDDATTLAKYTWNISIDATGAATILNASSNRAIRLYDNATYRLYTTPNSTYDAYPSPSMYKLDE